MVLIVVRGGRWGGSLTEVNRQMNSSQRENNNFISSGFRWPSAFCWLTLAVALTVSTISSLPLSFALGKPGMEKAKAKAETESPLQDVNKRYQR
mmetsp:Transcript_57066/g.121154  ORF Transcript_57066/g.121154 Transcript_57066/m.121154 type:complete len:94 (+) Transcript_57066:84-365(+)